MCGRDRLHAFGVFFLFFFVAIEAARKKMSGVGVSMRRNWSAYRSFLMSFMSEKVAFSGVRTFLSPLA